MNLLALVSVPILAALLNRFRGGWLPTGHDLIARSGYALGMAAFLAALLASLEPLSRKLVLISGLCAPLFYACEAWLPTGQFMGLGTTVPPPKSIFDRACIAIIGGLLGRLGQRSRYQVVMMTLVGAANVAGPAAVLAWFHYPVWGLLVAGSLKAGAYWVGNHTPSKKLHFQQGPELGELAFGFILGLGLDTVVLL